VKITGLLAALTVAVLATACSSGETGPSVASARDINSTIAAAPTPVALPRVVDAITAAGGTCGTEAARGEQACTLDGISFQFAADGWTRQADARRQACDGGWINDAFQLLTDGVWTIATDHNADLGTINAALSGRGILATTKDYCP